MSLLGEGGNDQRRRKAHLFPRKVRGIQEEQSCTRSVRQPYPTTAPGAHCLFVAVHSNYEIRAIENVSIRSNTICAVPECS